MAEPEDIEKLKKKLRDYSEKEIEFNDPHFTQQMMLREGSKEKVISNILKPDNLVYSYTEKGKQGDVVHCLHFRLSNTRTLRLPVIFINGKGLYILTYIKRYRSWQNMVKKVKK
jgi:hypothetical protein